MKKLNRKGFTLIELLAVIVILAIVMVVTIPSVINAMNSARSGQLKNAADTVADWLTKNYELSQYSGALGTDPVDKNYTSFMNGKSWTTGSGDSITYNVHTLTADDLANAGVSDTKGNTAKAKLSGNKICVQMTAASGETQGTEKSSFYVVNGTNTVNSTGCENVTFTN